jgi:hypothetical protein
MFTDEARKNSIVVRWGALTPEERFFTHVNKNGPIPVHRPELGSCHIWTGSTATGGYGALTFHGKTRRAHVIAWQLAGFEVPSGLCVLHKCDNRPCVRVEHLFVGTRGQNSADMVAKGRSPRGEASGAAKLSESVVLAIRAAHSAGVSRLLLAQRFDIQPPTVSKIVLGQRWTHLQEK